jgi:hypothetical protein
MPCVQFVGHPEYIRDERYERNQFMYNVCFVFDAQVGRSWKTLYLTHAIPNASCVLQMCCKFVPPPLSLRVDLVHVDTCLSALT